MEAAKNAQTETDLLVKEHRRKQRERRFAVIGIIATIIFLGSLVFALGSYDDYSVRSSSERGASTASKFTSFQGGIIEYSNDGILYMQTDGTLIWNQSFEMTSPDIDICGDYLVVFDRGGTSFYIMTTDGIQLSMEMGKTIRKACIASQGTVAVLSKNDGNAFLSMYDKEGNQLTEGELYAKEGYLAIDIALSTDAKKLAVDCIDITGGNLDTQISFYNFGSAGQSEIDNKVGEYVYEDTVFPEIDFISANTMLAISDTGYVVFEGRQKPEPTKEISFGREVESVFHNTKYVGIVYPNEDTENTRHISVFDLSGNTIMENRTTVSYNEIYFLENNEICALGDYQCEIYTIRSIKKFGYTWDNEVYKILYEGFWNQYILIRNGATEEIRLK